MMIGIQKILSEVPGIGPVKASKITDALGPLALFRIAENPSIVDQIKGIEGTGSSIKEFLSKRKGSVNISQRLYDMRIGKALHERIIEHFGGLPDYVRIVLDSDPYLLTHVDGLGFKRVDFGVIQAKMMAPSDPRRIGAVILSALQTASGVGHTYLLWDELKDFVQKVGVVPPIDSSRLDIGLAHIMERGDVIQPKDGVYAWKSIAFSEEYCASYLAKMLKNNPGIDSTITDDGERALQMAMVCPISIITGGPGTGKTTIIIKLLEKLRHQNVCLMAPTGKASKRMADVTKHPSCTIHSSLFNQECMSRLKEADVLIIDEFSMVSIDLLHALLGEAPVHFRIVAVGDVDQLPSVGPGACLKDMIESGVIPCTRLRKVHRQAADSPIIRLAHEVNNGEKSKLETSPCHRLMIMRLKDKDSEGAQITASTLGNRILDASKKFGYDPLEDIQVLTCQKTSPLGTQNLNAILRKSFIPQSIEKHKEHNGFVPGDKVIVTKNNSYINVVNGDIGFVVKSEPSMLTVKLDEERFVSFHDDQINTIQHAYAMTVHKAQGSEFKMVFLAIYTGMYWGLQRSLLYTGITRAKERLVLITNQKSFSIAVSNNKPQLRNTRLCGLLTESIAA